MTESLNYWTPRSSPAPARDLELRPTAAVPFDFDTLLSRTNDHAAAQAIVTTLTRIKIAVFRSNDGNRVGGETSLYVRKADKINASVVAAEIFVRREKINAIPRIEQPRESTVRTGGYYYLNF